MIVEGGTVAKQNIATYSIGEAPLSLKTFAISVHISDNLNKVIINTLFICSVLLVILCDTDYLRLSYAAIVDCLR